jgi:hypothetical protein
LRISAPQRERWRERERKRERKKRKKEETGGWRQLHNRIFVILALHMVVLLWQIKSRTMRWPAHVVAILGISKAHVILRRVFGA